VIREPSELVNTVAQDPACDHSGSAFRARLAATGLIESERADAIFSRTWSVDVVLDRPASGRLSDPPGLGGEGSPDSDDGTTGSVRRLG
jgi:hypothetical protein